MLKTIRRRLAFALVVSMLLLLFTGVSPVSAEDLSDLIAEPEFMPLLAVTLSSGGTTGATSATVTDYVYGNLLVNVTEQEIATPQVGEVAPTAGDNLITDYEPGADITAGVAAGNYLQIYDVDMEEGARIVAFYQAKLTEEDIKEDMEEGAEEEPGESRMTGAELMVEGRYTYIDENGVTKNTGTNTVTKITSDTATLNEGWYIVEGNINRTGAITVSGNVHLILADSSSLTVRGRGVDAGINVTEDNSLTIYAQSKGDEMGFLLATGGNYCAGIGGGALVSIGVITINGGIVTATGGNYAAGIGGGDGGDGGNVTINNGTVTATGGNCAAGIGGGNDGDGGNVTINNGTVTAIAIARYGGGAGIGGGFRGWGGSVTINGGKVTAKGGGYTGGAGIGAGKFGGNCTVTITGGEVHAMGGLGSAGIGGDDVTISNGTVIAIGDIDGGAGISGNVTISNGTITATGGFQNAGIEGTVTIIGGEVQARGGYSGAGVGSGDVTISNGIVTAVGGTFGAGIGGGCQGSSGEITIKGGTVTATGGDHAAGIGGGCEGSGGKITIEDGKVTATGGDGGAGIGGGGYPRLSGGSGGTIIINNYPTVIATGRGGGADIGNGRNAVGKTIIKHGDVQGKDLTYLRIEVKNLTPDYVHKITINEQEHEINSEWLTGFFVGKSTESISISLEPAGLFISLNPGDVQNSRIILNAHYSAKPVAGFGSALDFPANLQSRINVPFEDTKIGGISDFTISMWIFPRENEPYQTIFRQEEDTYGTLGLDFRFIKYNDDEGYLYFGFNRQSTGWQNAFPWNDETSLANITKIPMNRWTHVALTKLGKNIILYANGTKYYEMTLDPKHYNTPAPSKGNTSIGGTTAVNQFFSGRMDEIQFWNTALNPAEIEAWMYRGIDSSHNKYNNLVYYYKLNQDSGTTVIDSKGSYNGTLVNMTDGSWVVSDVRGWTVDAGSTLEGRLIGSHDAGSSNDGTYWNLTFEIVEQAKKGTATITGDNKFEYCTHDMNQAGHDSFTYRVKGPDGKYSNTQTVNIDIIPILIAGNGNSFGSPSNSQSTNNANGKSETVATATTTQEGDKTITTIVVNDKKVEKILEQEGNHAVVTISVNNGADVVIGTINGHTVKNMASKDAVLEIKTGQVTYTLPASQINIDAVSGQFGKQVELKDIEVSVKISEPAADTVKIVEDTADKNNYQIIVKPIEFEITCSSGSKTVEVSKFSAYVERMIAIPEGVDPSKITTGVILNSDGTFSHVPTVITMIDGKYYAKINSLTNSAYLLIYSPKTFQDVGKHWAEKDVNDMASRLVVSGVGDDKFEPDRDITRAEFAAIVVRALGLMSPGTGKDAFIDVMKKNWYYDAVSIAYEYGITSGYENGKFWPDDKITREQAMTMIARAMKITGSKVELADGEADKLLTSFTDAYSAAEYAKANIASCVKAGIVSGRSGKLIAPKDNITRAEVAVIVQRLLQNSNLI